jgi:NADH:ubiquinone oxidoreductase subunit K
MVKKNSLYLLTLNFKHLTDSMHEITLNEILFVSTALFFIGIYGFFTRRNLITMLMSIELILNSVNINFVAFNKYLYPEKLDGVFFTIFIIAIAAAEAAVAIAIIINLYRTHKSIDVEDASELKF